MLKIFSLFLLFVSALNAVQNVELIANNVEKKEFVTEAKGDVLVFSEAYLVSADRAIYNEKTGFLELFGNINIIRGKNEFVKSSHVKINFNSEVGKFEPFFTHDSKKKVWIDCKSAKGNKKYYMTKDSVVSSCDVVHPAWKLGFSEGKVNKKDSYVQLKNVVFYVRDVPVFYFPYFAFSADDTRRTGFLIPKLGYGFSEGLYYAQPFYVAQDIWWDLEITPQIRAKRGGGVYGKFRFVDTPTSKGEIVTGVFKDRKSYVQKENLKNKSHYGHELRYENDSLFEYLLGDGFDDGLWTNVTYLNDIDYLNLKSDGKGSSNNLITSRLNYFASSHKNYVGLYSKYYIDTSKVDNSNTLQEVPTVQYHHYLDALILPNVLYSIDANYHKYYRRKGVSANQFELDLPISYYTSFFDEFLHFSASENIYATLVDYDKKRSAKNEAFTTNFHKFSFFSEVAKSYENFDHTFKASVDYIVPSWKNGQITEDFISTQIEREKIEASLTQYFYTKNGRKLLRHSIAQSYNINGDEFKNDTFAESFSLYHEKTYKYGDVRHVVDLYFNDDLYIKNSLNYSPQRNALSKVQTSLHLKNNTIAMDVIHTYLDNKNNKNSFILSSLDYSYNRRYKVFTKYNYDIIKNYLNKWQIGIQVKKKCYEYTFLYKQEIKPKLTSAGADNVQKEGFYISFELYPFGGAEYDFSKESSL